MTTFNSKTSRHGSVRTTSGGVYKFEKQSAKTAYTTSSTDFSYYAPFIVKLVALTGFAVWVASLFN